MPNPGRLKELFLPGAVVYLQPSSKPEAKQPYVLVAVEKENVPVMLHTHRTNDVAQWLLNHKKIPGLEDATIIKREAALGHHRFDFLLDQGAKHYYLEVKSCTLVSGKVAMFPDAITTRGKQHLLALADLHDRHNQGGVLFIIHHPQPDFFLPDYHTDLAFAQTLIKVKDRIETKAVAVKWQQDLTFDLVPKHIIIPWGVIGKEAQDKGAYLLILKNKHHQQIEISALGKIDFPPGYYIYVGSARVNLTSRVERHKRLRKRFHWHIDYFRAKVEVVDALAIRSSDDLECFLAEGVKAMSQWQIKRFGSSDCCCESHLFGFVDNPLNHAGFQHWLLTMRMDRVVDHVQK